MVAKVYQYGCEPAGAVSPAAIAQLKLANRLWNDLVAAQHRHLERIEGIWREDPVLGPVLARIDAARTALESVVDRARALRQSARSNVRDPAAEDRAQAIRSELRDLYARAKGVRAGRRELYREEFRQSSAQMWEDARAARKSAVDDGAYWGTYDAVEADFKAALRLGRPLRFHRYDGEGRWHVRLQHELADMKAPATLERIMAGGSRWAGVLQVDPVDFSRWEDALRCERRQRSRTRARIRIGSEGRKPVWLELLVTLHRPVPAGGIIKAADVIRRKVGTHWRYSLCLTVLVPEAEGRGRYVGEGVAAVDIGWRQTGSGVRVAAVVGSDGRREEVKVDPRVVARIGRSEEISSVRDTRYREVRTALADWLKTNDAPDWLAERTGTLSHWGDASQARMAAVVLQWRESRFDGDGEIYAKLEAWRRWDKRQYDRQSFLRLRAQRLRRNQYRVLASQLVRDYAVVVVEDMLLPDMLRNEDPELPADEAAHNARHTAKVAAPGELRLAIRQCARHRGGEVAEVPAAYTTVVHNPCGQAVFGVDFAAGIMVWCPRCAMWFDQDFNACENLLDASRAPSRA